MSGDLTVLSLTSCELRCDQFVLGTLANCRQANWGGGSMCERGWLANSQMGVKSLQKYGSLELSMKTWLKIKPVRKHTEMVKPELW